VAAGGRAGGDKVQNTRSCSGVTRCRPVRSSAARGLPPRPARCTAACSATAQRGAVDRADAAGRDRFARLRLDDPRHHFEQRRVAGRDTSGRNTTIAPVRQPHHHRVGDRRVLRDRHFVVDDGAAVVTALGKPRARRRRCLRPSGRAALVVAPLPDAVSCNSTRTSAGNRCRTASSAARTASARSRATTSSVPPRASRSADASPLVSWASSCSSASPE